ncbi:VOC family protein [Natrinema gelatinilyticum]|uniref:VOC family protein n=1 Tax=Natrinema gelatinilyticum TaxID=2961571 RepID=UPI0020C3AED5|nr:VOC family protein [Natrinema gelatinilyticum]
MPSLHETTLIVTDLDRSVPFYRDVIGLEVAERRGSRVAFETGECTFVLEEEFDEKTFEAYNLPKPTGHRAEGVVTAFHVVDLDAIYERANEHDMTILTEPREAHWGERLFLVEDPDGYVIDVVTPL